MKSALLAICTALISITIIDNINLRKANEKLESLNKDIVGKANIELNKASNIIKSQKELLAIRLKCVDII